MYSSLKDSINFVFKGSIICFLDFDNNQIQ